MRSVVGVVTLSVVWQNFTGNISSFKQESALLGVSHEGKNWAKNFNTLMAIRNYIMLFVN